MISAVMAAICFLFGKCLRQETPWRTFWPNLYIVLGCAISLFAVFEVALECKAMWLVFVRFGCPCP